MINFATGASCYSERLGFRSDENLSVLLFRIVQCIFYGECAGRLDTDKISGDNKLGSAFFRMQFFKIKTDSGGRFFFRNRKFISRP